jgi:hypothetical protein
MSFAPMTTHVPNSLVRRDAQREAGRLRVAPFGDLAGDLLTFAVVDRTLNVVIGQRLRFPFVDRPPGHPIPHTTAVQNSITECARKRTLRNSALSRNIPLFQCVNRSLTRRIRSEDSASQAAYEGSIPFARSNPSNVTISVPCLLTSEYEAEPVVPDRAARSFRYRIYRPPNRRCLSLPGTGD